MSLYTDTVTVQLQDNVGNTATALFTIPVNAATPQAATPTFSPAAGTYTSAQTVTISDTTPAASIYYTTDGSTPTPSSTLYTAPITVSVTETVNAIAAAAGYTNSAVGSALYTINSGSALAALWSDPLSAGSVSSAYSYTLTASGGTPPYTFTRTAGTLPAGLTFASPTISGTPTTTVSADAVTFRVTDSVLATVTKATHITINAANTVPTNVQVISQGQESPVATQSPGCVTAGKGTGRAYLPNRNDIGWQGVSGTTSYNIYRAKNGGAYSLYANVTAANAASNYSAYFALYPAPAQTFGDFTNTQCGPASGINCAYTDNAATGIGSALGQSGTTFNAQATMTLGSANITVNSVAAGTLTVNQGIGTVLPTNIQIGTTIVSQTSGTTGGTGVYVMSQPALANFTGIVGSVQWGNVGFTYYVTAVTGASESAASAYAYLPFCTNGNLVHCNGAFNAYVMTQQTAPVASPLGWTTALACDISTGRFQSLNLFSGNSCINYNLNTVGYNWLNLSLCPSQPGHVPSGGNAEICGDASLLNVNGSQMAAYGPSTLAQNQWSTYKMPINIFNTAADTGVPQTAMYKITWGTNGPYVANDFMYMEYWFSVN